MAKVDLIVIGNELLNGKISDRNSKELGSILNANNMELNRVQIIGDNEQQFNEALERSLKSSEIVITSGGLGPTQDDLTKKMLGDYFKKPFKESNEALQLVESIYAAREKEYNKNVLNYHILPEGVSALNNPTGHAPGLFYQHEDKLIFSTPGVPFEFKSMVELEVIPIIKDIFKLDKSIYQFSIRTWKVPESKIFNEIDTKLWTALSKFGVISSLPHIFGVDIGVALRGSDSELSSKKNEIKDLIMNSPVADYVWQFGKLSLEELIVFEAKNKNLTLGFAESCTGGLCASKITDVSGSSQVFFGSIVSYANSVKIKSLGVLNETLNTQGAVSSQTALEMAIGAKEHLQVDIAVSTTGIAGPLGGSTEKPVGTVGIGFAGPLGSDSKIFNFNGDREILKQRFAHRALITMLEKIREI